jgi:hypothetical protein
MPNRKSPLVENLEYYGMLLGIGILRLDLNRYGKKVRLFKRMEDDLNYDIILVLKNLGIEGGTYKEYTGIYKIRKSFNGSKKNVTDC